MEVKMVQFQGKCCRDLKVTPHMVELFNSAIMYEKEEPGDGDELDSTIIMLQFQGKCCRDLKVTPHMVELFNSAIMYEKEEPGDGDELDSTIIMLHHHLSLRFGREACRTCGNPVPMRLPTLPVIPCNACLGPSLLARRGSRHLQYHFPSATSSSVRVYIRFKNTILEKADLSGRWMTFVGYLTLAEAFIYNIQKCVGGGRAFLAI
ncbi:uncharacterized protein LOC121857594 isoform X2 [Homarus americanus]|uniref:uncharacterized protein LOC121857594 isoform X2 n=1 Tax=Homarus americanus TaxID=6706 RepID=UPI001C446271|nr:uncharacterized protein LOC121857594 isoform X2 [Homarus americanus]